ncbi:hypothetical protein [Tranquillimonas rosea]|uniref:hypothetical protein n=1 Tax=Tranquillimonas rosea TaxID=641238 RepID=UPI003BAC0DE6
MMRISGGVLAAVILLQACAPRVPDSGPGVGFSEYDSSQGGQSGAGAAGSSPAEGPPTPRPAISSEELRQAGLPAAEPVDTAPLDNGATAPAAGQSVDTNNPGISDEQDFSAVSDRETIESDRERLEAQREAYRVIQPTALPTRNGAQGPNIVAYALQTSNAVGERVYRRSGFRAEAKFNNSCAQYASSDLAQEAFLANGGPERDRAGMDPDGDGFACYWDPTPFRESLR